MATNDHDQIKVDEEEEEIEEDEEEEDEEIFEEEEELLRKDIQRKDEKPYRRQRRFEEQIERRGYLQVCCCKVSCAGYEGRGAVGWLRHWLGNTLCCCRWALIDLVGGRARLALLLALTLFTFVLAAVLAPFLGSGLPCKATRLVLPPSRANATAVSPYNDYDAAAVRSSLVAGQLLVALLLLTGNSPWHSAAWFLPGLLLLAAYLFAATPDVLHWCKPYCLSPAAVPLSPLNCTAANATCLVEQLRLANCRHYVATRGQLDPAINWTVYVCMCAQAVAVALLLLVDIAAAVSRCRSSPLTDRVAAVRRRVRHLWQHHLAVPLRFLVANLLSLLLSVYVSLSAFTWSHGQLNQLEHSLLLVNATLTAANSSSPLVDALLSLPPALRLGSDLGMSLALAVFLAALLYSCWRVRRDVLAARRSGRAKDTTDGQRFEFSGATQFLGAVFYNNFFVIGLIWLLVTLLVVVFAWSPLRLALSSLWRWIVATTLSVLVSYLCRWFLLDRYAGHPRRGIVRPHLWRFLDFLVTLTSVLSGPIVALERLIMAVLATVIMLPVYDVPIAPYPLRSLDWLYSYYIHCLRLQHYVDVARGSTDNKVE